ncbi:MAG: type II secretion system protein [Candidatus Shapirobacteria bacterium]
MRKRWGVTLVELIIVIGILAVMVSVMAGILNPIALVNKARDVQRKKDLGRIKIAFEDYYNDKGCYPDQTLVAELMAKSVCKNYNFVDFPWLKPWPCDPSGTPYQILVGYDDKCPKWYKVLTSLENKTDKDIVLGLGETTVFGVANTEVNYGISSGNITTNQDMAKNDPHCVSLGNCYYYPASNMCNKIDRGCAGNNCYLGECSLQCKVSCCGIGCN